jgi:chemotaxis protein CheX
MKVELVNPFIHATTSVFRTMLGCELTRGQLSLKTNRAPEYEVSGLIGLTGKCQGMVVVSLGRDTAISATEIMLSERPDGLNRDVVDAVGEIANMIAGAAKAQLEQFQLSIGLPSVICGKNHSIGFPSNSAPIMLPFDSPIGPVCVEVGLSEAVIPLQPALAAT